METGRVAAVAEEEARKLQAEDPKARGGFWVRDRRNLGLIYVVPNADPEAEEAGADAAFTSSPTENDVLVGGEGDYVVTDAEVAVEPELADAETAEAPPTSDAKPAAENDPPPPLQQPDKI